MKFVIRAALLLFVSSAAFGQCGVMGKLVPNIVTGIQECAALWQVGTSLPATCVVGQVFFKSDATAGQNIYECAATNTWTQQLNSGGTGGDVSTTAGATFGAHTYDFTAATVSLPALHLRSDTGYTMTAGQKIVGTPSASVSGIRVVCGTLPSSPVAGDIACDAGGIFYGYSGSAWVPTTGTTRVAGGSKALATSAIASGACTSPQTATATGADPASPNFDSIVASFNGDPTGVTGYIPTTAGMLTIIPYLTTNTVNFKVCNNTSSSITPGAITLNYVVVR